MPAAIESSMARRFGYGRAPGSPRQTSQVRVFGGAPNHFAEQPQNIFERVSSSTWHSMPMIVSYRVATVMASTTVRARPACR